MITKIRDEFKDLTTLFHELRVATGRTTSAIFVVTDAQLMDGASEAADETERSLIEIAAVMNTIAKRMIETQEHLQLRRRMIKERMCAKCLDKQ